MDGKEKRQNPWEEDCMMNHKIQNEGCKKKKMYEKLLLNSFNNVTGQ